MVEVVEGFEGAAGPVTADDVGDGEEGTPVVRHAVVGSRGHGWVAGLENDEMVLSPAGELAAEDGFNFMVAAVEMRGDFPRFGFEEQDANGAVVEGVGERADTGENGGAECFVGTDRVTPTLTTVGAGSLFVTGVEKTAQFFGVGQVG